MESNTLRKAEKTAMSLGMPIPNRPEGTAEDLMWPKNVADLSTNDLAHHLTWWTAWSSYCRVHLARVETNYEAFSAEYRIETQINIMKSKGDYSKVTELKASVAQLPEMIKIESRMLQAEAEKRYLRALLETYEGRYKTCSREVSRRSAEWENA